MNKDAEFSEIIVNCHLKIYNRKTIMIYLKLMRVKHYVKNFLVFMPLFFSKNIFHTHKFISASLGFVCFCLVSSAVYILNDLKDIEKDRNHPKKRNRPIASGRVSRGRAIAVLSACLTAAVMISFFFLKKISMLVLLLYFVLNVAYSFGLKNIPIIDVVILASGFVIRVVYGGGLTNIRISGWLYLVMVSGSLFMGLGKRRNELKHQSCTREVLKFYNESFLDKNMYVAVALVIVFYALWTMESVSPAMIWTVPFFMIILIKYSYDIEGDSDGDPIEVLLHDRFLIILTVLYAVVIFLLLYIF